MKTPTFAQWREDVITNRCLKPRTCRVCYPSWTDKACVDCYDEAMKQRMDDIALYGRVSDGRDNQGL